MQENEDINLLNLLEKEISVFREIIATELQRSVANELVEAKVQNDNSKERTNLILKDFSVVVYGVPKRYIHFPPLQTSLSAWKPTSGAGSCPKA